MTARHGERVAAAEISALLRSMPDSDAPAVERDAWLARKRELLARVEAAGEPDTGKRPGHHTGPPTETPPPHQRAKSWQE